MNFELFLQGLIEIGLSFLTGLMVFFLSFKVFLMLTKDIDELSELKKNNVAVAVLISSFVFGIMLIVKSVISPAMDTLGVVLTTKVISPSFFFFNMLRIFIIYITASICSFILLWLSIKLFMALTTQIDEMKEIKNNNIAISIIIATLIISLSIIVFNPLKTLLNCFVASPGITEDMKMPLINFKVFSLGIIELVISIIASVLLFFYGFKIFNLFTKSIDEIKEVKQNNIAVAILVSAFIFSMMLLTKAVLIPVYDALGFSLGIDFSLKSVLFSIIQILSFFVLSAFFAFVLLWLAMKAFMIFTTTIDEMNEIKNKNVAIAIVVAILIISASLIVEHGLTIMLSGLIKTPDLGKGLLDISNLR